MPILLILLALLVILVANWFWRRYQRLQRDAFIRHYSFPHGLFEQLRKQHPQLSLKDCQLVANGLRQFFLAHLHSGQQFVAMPSQVADDLWHEFILYTRNYQAFCQQAFGRFFHHTPAAIMGSSAASDAGLQRCWREVCQEEHINPRAPTRLPLLFALDSKLQIANGYRYVPDCSGVQRSTDGSSTVHCGGALGSCGGGDGGSDGSSSDSDGGGGDGGGCGGGCGGGGD